MKEQDFTEREVERAKRLVEFVKGEVRSMWVEARFAFVIDMFNYFQPELKELMRNGDIKRDCDAD